jgi:tetratricopeptide (TPR) repeat protein
MKRAFSHRLFLMALLVCAFAYAPASAADTWVQVESQNFRLIGNASEKEIRRVATKLEQFREVFKTLFPKLQFSSPIETTVIVFKNGRSFKPYKPVTTDGKTTEWIAGFFQSGEDQNYIVLSTEGETRQTYTTIFHEYVHLLVNNSFGRSRVPPWFNEGIAEYYEQFAIEEDQKVELGNLNNNHLYTLQRSKLIPFETFFNIDYYGLHSQGGHGANIFYAQSWAFMHYLIHGNKGSRRGLVNVFLTALLNGKKPQEAFESTFKTDFVTMERELKNYVEQRSFAGILVKLDQKLVFDTGMSVSPISETAAKATLGDLLFRSNRLADAESHLSESLASDPDSAAANASLGMIRMRQKRFPEARQLLEKAVAKESKNHLVHFRYAYVLSRESFNDENMVMSFPDETAGKMREALRKAIALSPGFPESYSLLAFISLVRNDEIDESIDFISKALKLSPGNQEYMLHLAGLHSRKGEHDKARQIAESVLRSSADEETRFHATSVLNSVNALREYADMRKNTGDGPNKLQRSVVIYSDEKPLTDEEVEKLREKAKLEGINESLRTVKAGEKRVLARLSKIECDRTGIIYSAAVGTESLRLRSKDFQTLELMTFAPLAQDEIGCQGLTKELFSVLTYVPGDDPKTKTAGAIVAIEIVPEDFRFLDE